MTIEEIKEYKKNWAKEKRKDPEWKAKQNANRKISRVRYKDIELEKNRKWKASNKERVKEYRKQYWKKNQEQEKENFAKWKSENEDYYKEIKSQCDKNYRLNNKEKIKEQKENYKLIRNEQQRDRYYSDINYNISKKLRASFRQAFELQGKVKKERVLKYLGCSLDELKIHLEKQFTIGMNWENKGEWHIDHIKPVSLFDHSNEEQIKECWNYKNLQPLWETDNCKKSNKY